MKHEIPVAAARIGRRGFLGCITLTAGGVAAASLLPAPLFAAVPRAAGGPLDCAVADSWGDWQLDDICCSYPPYAFRIDAGRPQHAVPDRSGTADWHWVA